MTAAPWEPLTTLSERLAGQAVVLGKNVTIHPTAVIEGPVQLGDNCVVGVGAYIRPYCLVGNDCVIGHATEIKHCILGDKVILPHFNYVGDSILGNNVHLGGGAVIANYRIDGGEIKNSGLKKFGAIIGNNVEIGTGAILNPGTIIGDNVTIYPGAVIRQDVPTNSIVKVKTEQEIVEKH